MKCFYQFVGKGFFVLKMQRKQKSAKMVTFLENSFTNILTQIGESNSVNSIYDYLLY